MKKKILLALSCVAMLMTACDKVEDYTIYAVTGTWTSGNGVADKTQRVFLEKYTGPRCTNCPDADVVINNALQANPEKLIAVSIVDFSTFGNPYLEQIDMRTEDGDAWSKYFGITQYPTAMFNRAKANGAWELITSKDAIGAKANALVSQNNTPAVAMEMNCPSPNVINIDMEILKEGLPNMTLTLLVIEDSLVAKQASNEGTIENYVSNHMLRDIVTAPWGTNFQTKDANTGSNIGNKISVVFNYEPNKEWKLNHCKYVAFVSNKATREVINCAECEVLPENE